MSQLLERKGSLKPALSRKLSATSTVSSRSSCESHSRPASLISSASTSSKRSNVSSFFKAFTIARSGSQASLASPSCPPRSASSEGLAWHLPEYEKQAGDRAALTPWEAYLPFSAELEPKPEPKVKRFEMSKEEMEFRGIKADLDGSYPSYTSSVSPPGSAHSTLLQSPPKRLPVMIASTTGPIIPAQYPPLPWTSTPPDNVVPYIPPASAVAAAKSATPSGRVIMSDAPLPARPARPPRPTTSPSLPSVPTVSYVSVPERRSTGSTESIKSFTISHSIVKTQASDTLPASSSYTTFTSHTHSPSASLAVPGRPSQPAVADEVGDGSFTSTGSSFEGLSLISPTFGDFTSGQAEETGKSLRWSGNQSGRLEDVAEGLFSVDREDQWSDIEDVEEDSAVDDTPVVSTSAPATGKPKGAPAPIMAPPAHLSLHNHNNRPLRSPRSPMSQHSPRIRRASRRKTLGLHPLQSSSIKRYQEKRGRRLSIVIESNSLSQSLSHGHPFAMPVQEDDFPVDVSPDEEYFF